jgi:hypothetical protein
VIYMLLIGIIDVIYMLLIGIIDVIYMLLIGIIDVIYMLFIVIDGFCIPYLFAKQLPPRRANHLDLQQTDKQRNKFIFQDSLA